MAEKIQSQTKQKVTLEPSGGGCFELTVDGDLIFSKLKTGQFPNEDAMIKEISNRMGK